MTSARAAILETSPGDLVIDDIEVADVGPREVLVRTSAAGLCHSDLHFMQGLYPYMLPMVAGHEAAGVVEAIGSEVTGFRVGDHVVSCVSGFCGACRWCLTGRSYLCDRVGLTRGEGETPSLSRNGTPLTPFSNLGCFAELMLLHEHFLVKVTDDIPIEKAALIGCGVTTGVGAVINTAAVRAGDTVAVLGCGGIGLNAIQAARLVGASRIIAVDRLDSKLEMAKAFGATDVVNAANDDAVTAVMELTGGGVDHAIEAIGLKATAEQAFQMLGKDGTATVIGMVPFGQKIELDATQLLGGRHIQGSNMGSNRFRLDIPRYVDWYLDGRLDLDSLVSATMPLDEINAGFATLSGGEVARQLVTFD
ncbi:MAG: Zn-dependent alcohol dehydrogenase [Acidimicrobiia bacterium]